MAEAPVLYVFGCVSLVGYHVHKVRRGRHYFRQVRSLSGSANIYVRNIIGRLMDQKLKNNKSLQDSLTAMGSQVCGCCVPIGDADKVGTE